MSLSKANSRHSFTFTKSLNGLCPKYMNMIVWWLADPAQDQLPCTRSRHGLNLPGSKDTEVRWGQNLFSGCATLILWNEPGVYLGEGALAPGSPKWHQKEKKGRKVRKKERKKKRERRGTRKNTKINQHDQSLGRYGVLSARRAGPPGKKPSGAPNRR